MHADNCWGAVDGQFAGPKALRILMACRADVFYENYEQLVKLGQKTISGETLLAKK